MISAEQQWIWLALFAFGFLILLWILQVFTKDAGIGDVGWSFGLGASGVFLGVVGEGDPARRVLIAVLAGTWGLRLALHLLRDRVLKGPEDGRYLYLRERLGSRVQAVMFPVFLLQAILILIFSLPFWLAANADTRSPGFLDVAGAVVWLAGIAGEALADHQLKRFKHRQDSAGQVCRVGLWSWSRHPNYFFEWLIWVGYGMIASSAVPLWLAWLAPALMLLMILKFSGIPPTEARALRTRGDAYRTYQREVSAFIPWPPKKRKPDPAS